MTVAFVQTRIDLQGVFGFSLRILGGGNVFLWACLLTFRRTVLSPSSRRGEPEL